MSTSKCNRTRGCKPETETKYRPALELYATFDLSTAEICRQCGVSISGFTRYIGVYHRHLMLRRNGIKCSPQEAEGIKLKQRGGQLPATHAKYREAIAACDSMEYIECNVSEIAREFGLTGSNLGRQLRTHYLEVLELREQTRQRLGLDDGLPRGSRRWSREQYVDAVEMLRADRYVTVQEAAKRCNVSYAGLEQHLIFYHKDLVDRRIAVRKEAVGQQYPGMITGKGTVHAPSAKVVEKYAGALEMLTSTPLSVREIARRTGVSLKGLYEYLRTWHCGLLDRRRGTYCSAGVKTALPAGSKYNPATAAKYADAIRKLRESSGGATTAAVGAEFGLHPDAFRQYLKEHEPELHATLGMKRSESGRAMSAKSMEKYREAVRLYQTTPESLKSIARRLGLNCCSLGQFIRRHFPEAGEKHRRLQSSGD